MPGIVFQIGVPPIRIDILTASFPGGVGPKPKTGAAFRVPLSSSSPYPLATMTNSKKSSQPKKVDNKPVDEIAAAQPHAPAADKEEYDPEQAKAHFETYRARIEPILEAQFAFVRLDAESAAFAGLRVDKLIKTTSLLAPYKKQLKEMMGGPEIAA